MSRESPRALRRLVAPPEAARSPTEDLQLIFRFRDQKLVRIGADCWSSVGLLAAPGGATRRRKARGDSRDTHGSSKLHKIIIHNVSNNAEAIRSAHDGFGRL